jgi:hypothetical protein
LLAGVKGQVFVAGEEFQPPHIPEETILVLALERCSNALYQSTALAVPNTAFKQRVLTPELLRLGELRKRIRNIYKR